jgi:hypothetical protein
MNKKEEIQKELQKEINLIEKLIDQLINEKLDLKEKKIILNYLFTKINSLKKHLGCIEDEIVKDILMDGDF